MLRHPIASPPTASPIASPDRSWVDFEGLYAFHTSKQPDLSNFTSLLAAQDQSAGGSLGALGIALPTSASIGQWSSVRHIASQTNAADFRDVRPPPAHPRLKR